MSAPRIYVYKLVADNGGAPCVHQGLLSLAICKPKIRKAACVGDFIIGFGGKRLNRRLIYAAKITTKPPLADYYTNEQYTKRPDCIYNNTEGVAELKKKAKFHSAGDQLNKDVGLRFQHANVLLSDDFIYFGSNGHREHETLYPNLTNMLNRLRQGHRVHHKPAIQSELQILITELWRLSKRGVIGKPSDQDHTLRCNQDKE